VNIEEFKNMMKDKAGYFFSFSVGKTITFFSPERIHFTDDTFILFDENHPVYWDDISPNMAYENKLISLDEFVELEKLYRIKEEFDLIQHEKAELVRLYEKYIGE